MRQRKSIAPRTARVVAGLGLSMLLACSDSDTDSEHDDEHSGSSSGGSGGKAQGGSTGSAGKAGAGGKASAGNGGNSATGSAGKQAGAGAGGHGGDSGHGGSAAGKGGSGGSAAGSGGNAAGSGGSAAGAGGNAAGSGGGSAQAGMAVTIRFKAKVGAQDFACGQEYDAQGSANTRITPQDFRMFVQDLSLIRDDDSVVPVQLDVRAPWQSDKVALLDFENNSGGCIGNTSEMNTEITGHVPEGNYKGVSFANGVPEDINHKDPATQPDPLKTYANLSWGWLTGFRYSKLEVIQVVPAGQVFGIGLAHPGATACTGNAMQNTVMCAKPNRNKITLQPFDASSDAVLIDLGAVFKGTNLTEMAECHSTGSYCTSMFDALGINFADGKPKDGQTVFKVE